MSPDDVGGGGVLGAIGSAISSAVSAIGNFFGNLFFKAGEGGAVRGVDGGALGARLGAGRALDGASRSRMGAAFGYDFGAVRVHDDAPAAALAEGLHARAFTLGTHVAFAAGQHRPGQPEGDALLAHELAHVVQQGGATTAAPAIGEPHDAFEEDADRAAAGAVAALYAPEQAPRDRGPRVRGGLRLSRCGASTPQAASPTMERGTCSEAQAGDPTASCCTQPMLDELSAARREASDKVGRAVRALGTPQSAGALRAHFRVELTNNDAMLQIMGVLAGVKLGLDNATTYGFNCRQKESGLAGCNLGVYASSPNNTAGNTTICGNMTGPQFLGLPANDHSVRTIIHEFVHLTGSGILGAGVEQSYSTATFEGTVPPLRNADCYAHLVDDLTR
jgi:hypothetical protein